MDPYFLKQAGVEPYNPRHGYVDNYKLKIGNKATLLRSPGTRTHGIVYSLSHSDINRLYWGAGMDEYAAEALIANINNELIPVLCCNLIIPPGESESNLDYARKLKTSMENLGVEYNNAYHQ